MMQFLPSEIHHCVNPKKSNLENCFNNGSIGCFLRVDLDYPDKLHGIPNDDPLYPEKSWTSQK